MSAAEQRQKSSKMAADLVKRGIYHGRHMTKPTHANYPKPNEVGSAAYRRMQAKQRTQNQKLEYIPPAVEYKKSKKKSKTTPAETMLKEIFEAA